MLPAALQACSVGALPICGEDQRLKGAATGAHVRQHSRPGRFMFRPH
jgi:hypothetical protein